MAIAGEITPLYDCFIIRLDIEDSPSAEVLLVDVYDMVSSALFDNYLDVFRETMVQILEDTSWITESMIDEFVSASFGIFEIRDGGTPISLRALSLQRLIGQSISNRPMPIELLQIPLLFRFKSPEKALPSPPRLTAPADSDRVSEPLLARSGPPSNVSEAEHLDQVSALPGASPIPLLQTRITSNVAFVPDPGQPNLDAMSAPDTTTGTTFRTEPGPVPGTGFRAAPEPTPNVGPSFRGNRINMDRPTAMPNATARGHDFDPYDGRPNGYPSSSRRNPLFDYERTPMMARTPSRAHPYSNEVIIGVETFQDYMSQFHYSEVKYKDFRKVTIPKFDSSKNDSFVHWYKHLVSTCLQWGIWCPPYESIEEDKVYGAWWPLLPQSVRDQKSFMGHLLYSLLLKPETFPANSREMEAVEGSTANAGYNAIYNVLRMHHPLLDSVYSTANEIPRQRRAETFSLYSRRIQDFIARERLAGRTYTESEALDLAGRNVTPEWRSEFRRLISRDKFSGNGGTLPFKLQLPQLATTFVEYADELGREPPGSRNATPGRPPPSAIMRRLESSHEEEALDGLFLPDEDIDLLVNAIASNQQSSAVCVGCQLPGHTLTECNRFVDYVVAESLAQRHPDLRRQIANSHTQFRTRLNSANARGRLTSSAAPPGRAVRSLQLATSSSDHPDEVSPSTNDSTSDDVHDDYRQHSIRAVDDPTSPDDFETCFTHLTMNAVTVVDLAEALSLSDDAAQDTTDPLESFQVRRLAETYDSTTSSVYAHADNGSMACTSGDAKLLFAYRPLQTSNVRLFDAGNNIHRPLGVGFLCVPTDNRGIGGAPDFVFVRTYHTPTIPGVILSHSAISKQLKTSSYHVSSHHDEHGFMHFPHRLRRNQDIFISIQPISRRGGLTFTEALILPTDVQHHEPVPPWPTRVHRLCTDHAPTDLSSASIVDPTDGMTCHECHEPPDVSCGGRCRTHSVTPDFC